MSKQLFAIALLACIAFVAADDTCSCFCGSGQTAITTVSSCTSCATAYCQNSCFSSFGAITTSGQSCSNGTLSVSLCFPANAVVELEDGTQQTMANLKIGDKVLVGENKYSEVYMFSHNDAGAVATFMKIETSANLTLLLTPDHYLYLNGKLVISKLAKVGDVVITRDGSEAEIVSVSVVRENGLYNPHTLQGDIVVNGIKTSSYTSAIAPTLAHTMLWPVRMLYTLGYDIVNGAFEEGSNLWTAIAPRGRDAY